MTSPPSENRPPSAEPPVGRESIPRQDPPPLPASQAPADTAPGESPVVPDSRNGKPRAFPRSKGAKTVVGVDLGHNVIRMVRLRAAGDGRFTLEGWRSVPLNPRLPVGSPEFVATLKGGLKDFCGSLRETEIWTTPRLDRVRIQHLQIPRVNSSRLPGAVFWALKREEPFPENETVVDFEVDGENAAPAAGPLQVTGFLAPREDLEKLSRSFSQAGFPVTGVAPPTYGLRNLFREGLIETPDAPVVMASIGQESSRVSILAGGRSVFTRSIPIGLQSLAETLIQELKPAPAGIQASSLILEFGNEGQEKQPWPEEAVFNVLRPALERLARQIQRTLEYYQTNYKVERVQHVYLTGAIASRSRLTDLIASQLSARLVILNAFESTRLQAGTDLPEAAAERIEFTPALGLALSGDGRTPNLARTYRDRQRERQARQVKAGIFALFMVLAAVCGAFYGWQQVQLRGLQAEKETLSASLRAAGPSLNETMILTAMAEIQQHQARLKEVSRRYEAVGLIGELAGLTPDYVRLHHLSGRFGSPVPVNSADRRQTVRVEGVVRGERASLEAYLTVFVARLDQSPLVRNVEVEKTDLVESGEGLHLSFALSMETGERREAPAK